MTRPGKLFGAAVLCAAVMAVSPRTTISSWANPGRQGDKPDESDGEKLIKANDCVSCHAVDRRIVGPSYREIAKKYADQSDAVTQLTKRVREGGAGSWGTIPMTAHPDLTDAQLKDMISWILSQKDSTSAADQSGGKTYEYTKDGQTIKLDFQLFAEGKGEKITKDVFKGYELYDSYCYRCHGTDATESELAPDLKHSLESGMTAQDFLSTAMAGREDKGMPPWAGFLSEEEVKNIYKYVKGRSVGLIPTGRPPSETD